MSDADITVPRDRSRVLRLSPVLVVKDEADGVVIASETEAIVVTQAIAEVRVALTMLRVGASLREIASRVGSQVAAGLVRALMHVGGLVTEDPQTYRDSPYVNQLGYFSALVRSPLRAQAQVSSAKVGILGVGGVGSVVLQHLVAAGVSDFVLIDADHVAQKDLNRQMIYRFPDIGRVKVAAARDYVIDRAPEATVRTIIREVAGPADLAAETGDVDVLVVAADRPPLVVGQWATEFSLDTGIPVTTCSVGIETGVWGPLCVPGVTACATCIEKADVEQIPLTEREFRIRDLTELAVSFGPVNTVLGALCARDLVHWLAGAGSCPSLGAQMTLNLRSLRTSRTYVPRCDHVRTGDR